MLPKHVLEECLNSMTCQQSDVIVTACCTRVLSRGFFNPVLRCCGGMCYKRVSEKILYRRVLVVHKGVHWKHSKTVFCESLGKDVCKSGVQESSTGD